MKKKYLVHSLICDCGKRFTKEDIDGGRCTSCMSIILPTKSRVEGGSIWLMRYTYRELLPRKGQRDTYSSVHISVSQSIAAARARRQLGERKYLNVRDERGVDYVKLKDGAEELLIATFIEYRNLLDKIGVITSEEFCKPTMASIEELTNQFCDKMDICFPHPDRPLTKAVVDRVLREYKLARCTCWTSHSYVYGIGLKRRQVLESFEKLIPS